MVEPLYVPQRPTFDPNQEEEAAPSMSLQEFREGLRNPTNRISNFIKFFREEYGQLIAGWEKNRKDFGIELNHPKTRAFCKFRDNSGQQYNRLVHDLKTMDELGIGLADKIERQEIIKLREEIISQLYDAYAIMHSVKGAIDHVLFDNW